MSVVALTVAVLQTGVVPILGVMSHQLHVSLANISWTVTANLLAAASTTPLLGRLADLHTKKRVLLAVLAAVLAGSLLAATTSSFALLIVARVLQGASFSLYPIGVSILREELSPERLMGALAVLSAVLGFGGGMGLVGAGRREARAQRGGAGVPALRAAAELVEQFGDDRVVAGLGRRPLAPPRGLAEDDPVVAGGRDPRRGRPPRGLRHRAALRRLRRSALAEQRGAQGQGKTAEERGHGA